MFKCPVCSKRMERITYTKWGRRFHYFVCECGWTNKPADVPVANNSTETNNEPTVGSEVKE